MKWHVEATENFAVIYIPWGDVHGVRVALADCPCGAVKSNATKETRNSLAMALSRAETKRAGASKQRNQPKT